MKYILSIILALSYGSISLASSQIQLHAIRGSDGVIKSYRAITWSGPDGAMTFTSYTVAEAQLKFSVLLERSSSGTSVNPDRLILNYNEDSGLASVEFHVTTGNFERTIQKNGAISTDVKIDASAARVDLETKIGKDIGGGPIKPPKVEPVPEGEVVTP